MNLGNIIKTIRKDRGQTQGEFAELCGITQTYLSQIERNLKDPNFATIKRISNKLEIPVPILFFKSLTVDDVNEEKIELYKNVSSELNNLINEFYKI